MRIDTKYWDKPKVGMIGDRNEVIIVGEEVRGGEEYYIWKYESSNQLFSNTKDMIDIKYLYKEGSNSEYNNHPVDELLNIVFDNLSFKHEVYRISLEDKNKYIEFKSEYALDLIKSAPYRLKDIYNTKLKVLLEQKMSPHYLLESIAYEYVKEFKDQINFKIY